MVTFKTNRITASVQNGALPIIKGHWRKRENERHFTDDQIRVIRNDPRSTRKIAENLDVSGVLIYYIKKRAIYSDVI